MYFKYFFKERKMDSNLSYYVALAMQGDHTALEELYKQTYWTVYYTCFGLLKNEQDAADVTQEVYVTVMNSLTTLQDKDKFLPWLHRIAVNKCKNVLAKNHPVITDLDADETSILEDNENFLPEDYVTNREKCQLVMNIIRTCLSEVQYRTVFLHYFNGFSVEEIAEIMECPVGTVTYRLSAARGKIKQAVLKYENVNNEKLYAIGGLPLLACIFTEEFKSLYNASPIAAHVLEPVSTNTAGAGAAASASGAAGNGVAQKGANGMLKTLKAKIIASAAGVVIVAGIAAAIVLNQKGDDKKQPANADSTMEQTNTTALADENGSSAETQTEDAQSTEETTEQSAAASAEARNLNIKLYVTGEFQEGLAPVKESKDSGWGFIDEQGNLVIDCQYESVYGFQEGLACVQNQYGFWGFIDTTGNLVIPCNYDHVSYFSEGVVHAIEGSKGYILDKTGAVLAETDYESSGMCSDGLISVKKDEKWGYIDTQGNLVIDCQYDINLDFSEGLAWVSQGEKAGYIDTQGNTVIDFIYDDSPQSASSFVNGYAVVKKDGKCGMIDASGNTVIDFIYDYLGAYTPDGLIVAEKDGLYGYIDISGNTVIDFQYESAYAFHDGLAFVAPDNKFGFIDTNGNTVIDFIYDMNYTPHEYCFTDGLAPMIYDDQGCYIDKNGNVVIGKIE